MASWMGCEGSAREPRALGVGAIDTTAWDWQSGGQEESGSGESWNWGPTRHPLPSPGPPIPEGGLAAPDAAPELPAPLRRPSSSWGGPDTARTDRSARPTTLPPPPLGALLSRTGVGGVPVPQSRMERCLPRPVPGLWCGGLRCRKPPVLAPVPGKKAPGVQMFRLSCVTVGQ